jgi:hypothetical protein
MLETTTEKDKPYIESRIQDKLKKLSENQEKIAELKEKELAKLRSKDAHLKDELVKLK